jgi:hypothetical protein
MPYDAIYIRAGLARSFRFLPVGFWPNLPLPVNFYSYNFFTNKLDLKLIQIDTCFFSKGT